jgi:hypothetical protein
MNKLQRMFCTDADLIYKELKRNYPGVRLVEPNSEFGITGSRYIEHMGAMVCALDVTSNSFTACGGVMSYNRIEKEIKAISKRVNTTHENIKKWEEKL